MRTHADPATVLGAGLMGRLMAVALAERGHPVRLMDAAGPDLARPTAAAAWVAAAMLAPLAESVVAEPAVVRMGQYSLQRWPALLADLPEPVFFQQAGSLLLWHRADAAEAQRQRQLLARTARTHPELPPAQTLDGAALAALEPALAGRFEQALHLPGEGQLDNRALLAALARRLQALGVDWQQREVADPAELGLPAQHWLIDCRGLGARAQWPTLRGVRGEVLRLHAPELVLQRPVRLLHPRYALYIAPKPGGVFVVGATEIESDDESPVSVRSALELLSACYSVHPGLGEARILEQASQRRPTLPDHLPALRPLGPRHLQINGLYRHGFLIAPAMRDLALAWLDGDAAPLACQFGLPAPPTWAPSVWHPPHDTQGMAPTA